MPPRQKKTNRSAGKAGSAKVAFDYIKSSHFRVVRADGAIGALTPNGTIHFSLFSERPAIPRRLVHAIHPDGTLGPPLGAETISRGSIVREMEVDIFLRPEVAETLAAWLAERITEAKQRAALISPKRARGPRK